MLKFDSKEMWTLLCNYKIGIENLSEIYSKLTQYILHLEREEVRLTKERNQLAERNDDLYMQVKALEEQLEERSEK